MATGSIDNNEDVIDSRNVIERIEELQGERDSLQQDVEDAEGAQDADDNEATEAAHADALTALNDWDDSEEAYELRTLKALAEEGEGYSDWEHGAQLIRDSYFRDYAIELAEEIGAIPADSRWPNNCIDWDQAARELRMDYSGIDFDGVTYWVR